MPAMWSSKKSGKATFIFLYILCVLKERQIKFISISPFNTTAFQRALNSIWSFESSAVRWKKGTKKLCFDQGTKKLCFDQVFYWFRDKNGWLSGLYPVIKEPILTYKFCETVLLKCVIKAIYDIGSVPCIDNNPILLNLSTNSTLS